VRGDSQMTRALLSVATATHRQQVSQRRGLEEPDHLGVKAGEDILKVAAGMEVVTANTNLLPSPPLGLSVRCEIPERNGAKPVSHKLLDLFPDPAEGATGFRGHELTRVKPSASVGGNDDIVSGDVRRVVCQGVTPRVTAMQADDLRRSQGVEDLREGCLRRPCRFSDLSQHYGHRTPIALGEEDQPADGVAGPLGKFHCVASK